jgi:hypothetical protein
LFKVLSDRAEFKYNMGLLIASQVLQGTGIGNPGWRVKKVKKKSRVRTKPPVEIPQPIGPPRKVDTWESDNFKVITETVEESWPFFEYRRLGTTFYDPGWRTPNRPDQSAGYKLDVDYVDFEDLAQMRNMDCYKNIPADEDLKKFFMVASPQGDAPPQTQTAQEMNTNSTVVLHAVGEHKQTSLNPLQKPLLKIARWENNWVCEVLLYQGRHLTIRNGEHEMDDHALGYAANWWDIDNSGYGMGIGRLNAGDQRMDQGVLNEVLKMIAYWTNAPMAYDSRSGNAPTQNNVFGLGTLWGVDPGPSGNVGNALRYVEKPPIPKEAFQIYEMGLTGGQQLVGADATVMQGNTGPGSTALRTATGVNRLGGKADENISDPVDHLEGVIQRWISFLWEMVKDVMPLSEIRQILSRKFGETIFEQIDADSFLDADFEISILAGQKLQAKQSIMQLVPFFFQILQQPQLMEHLQQTGRTVNFQAMEDLMMRMSELAGRQDIFIPMTDQQKAEYQQNNPAIVKAKADAAREDQRGHNKLQEIAAKGAQETQQTILKPIVEAVAPQAASKLEGSQQLEDAEARLERNTDMTELAQGVE